MEDITLWSLIASANKLVIYISSFVAAGSILFLFFLRPSDEQAISRLLRLSLILSLIAIIATIIRVMVQAGRLMDDGLAGMLDFEIIQLSLEGPLGTSTYARLTGLGLLVLAVVVPKFRNFAGALGAIAIAQSFALTGHATRNPQWLLFPLLTLHLLAVSYWVGALAPLHYLAGKGKNLDYAADISERFGKQASVIVPILIIAGVIFAYMIVGSFENLFSTNYGWVLLGKLIAVACVLALATANKFRFVPALLSGREQAGLAFRRAIKIEFGVFLVIFAATAFLTTTYTLPQ